MPPRDFFRARLAAVMAACAHQPSLALAQEGMLLVWLSQQERTPAHYDGLLRALAYDTERPIIARSARRILSSWRLATRALPPGVAEEAPILLQTCAA